MHKSLRTGNRLSSHSVQNAFPFSVCFCLFFFVPMQKCFRCLGPLKSLNLHFRPKQRRHCECTLFGIQGILLIQVEWKLKANVEFVKTKIKVAIIST